MNAPKNHDHLRMPAMRKEKTAVRDAAKWRGHDMSAWIIVRLQDGTREHHTACRICGAYARCAPWPAPNGIDIYGTAVALNCPAPVERGSERDQVRALGRKIRARRARMDRDGYVDGQYYGDHPTNAIFDVTTDTSSYMVRARSRDAAIISVARVEENKRRAAALKHAPLGPSTRFIRCAGCQSAFCGDPSCQAQAGGDK